jgi:hypothetical protein
MVMIKSLATSGFVSLLIANLAHDNSGDGGVLMISDFPVGDYRVAWSWPLFAVVTVVTWALFKALSQASSR